MTTTERKTMLEATISNIAGVAVELTIRGLRSFTVSYEGSVEAANAAIAKFFGSAAECRCHFDAECDFTCCYIEVA